MRTQPRPHQQRSRVSRRAALAVALLLLAAVTGAWQATLFLRTPPSCQQAAQQALAAHARAALGGDWASKAPFNPASSIPVQQLWQTSRSKQLSARAQKLQDSWQQLNPALNITVMDDANAAAFISSWYGADVAAVYRGYALQVMRADFWRYAVLFALGGIYSDIDTKCLRPIRNWFPPRSPPLPTDLFFVSNATNWTAPGPTQYHNLTWGDCSLVAALENGAHIAQWLIASVPGHPILRAALSVALRSVERGFSCTNEHIVHALTGPTVWTQAFSEVLGLPSGSSAAEISRAAWTDPAVYQRARALRVCIVAHSFWGTTNFVNSTAQNALNEYSSQWAEGNPNTPWIKEREQLAASAKRWERRRAHHPD